MIKIQVDNINFVLNLFYNRICLDGKHGTIGLITKIKNRRLTEPNLKRVKFYSLLIKDITLTGGRSIIIDNPFLLEQRLGVYERDYGDILTSDFSKDLEDNVFFYSDYKKWGSYDLAKALNINTCPYCNRQFTFTLETSNGKTRPQFDHFLSKAKHPYFSLSFYNLIPSCYICNSSLKGTEEFSTKTHIHPYVEDYSEIFSFSISPTRVTFIDGQSSAYKIKFKFKGMNENLEKIKRIAGNLRVFKIHQLYNMHKDHVDELIIKSRIYNEDYLKALLNEFKGELFSDLNDVKRMVVSNYVVPEDFGKRILSKLTYDISKSINLI